MIKLTKLEQTVYDTIRALEAEGDAFDFQDVCMTCDMENTRARGVVVSLVKKGLVQTVQIPFEDGVMDSYQTRSIEEVEAELAASKVTVEAKKDEKPKKVSNASRVREQIAQVKETMSKEEAMAVVMQFCMEQLGQSKQLAKTYFTENWERV